MPSLTLPAVKRGVPPPEVPVRRQMAQPHVIPWVVSALLYPVSIRGRCTLSVENIYPQNMSRVFGIVLWQQCEPGTFHGSVFPSLILVYPPCGYDYKSTKYTFNDHTPFGSMDRVSASISSINWLRSTRVIASWYDFGPPPGLVGFWLTTDNATPSESRFD